MNKYLDWSKRDYYGDILSEDEDPLLKRQTRCEHVTSMEKYKLLDLLGSPLDIRFHYDMSGEIAVKFKGHKI